MGNKVPGNLLYFYLELKSLVDGGSACFYDQPNSLLNLLNYPYRNCSFPCMVDSICLPRLSSGGPLKNILHFQSFTMTNLTLTEFKMKRRFEEWVENHPDVWYEERFWYVQNAIGDLLGWPEWWSEFVSELEKSQSS